MLVACGDDDALDAGPSQDAGTDAPVADVGGTDAGADAGDDASTADVGREEDSGTDAAPTTDARVDAASDVGVDAGPDVPLVLDETSCDDRFMGALLCDGFEERRGGAFENSPYLERDNDGQYRGLWFGRLRRVGGDGFALESVDLDPDLESGSVHFRAYMYVAGRLGGFFLNIGQPQTTMIVRSWTADQSDVLVTDSRPVDHSRRTEGTTGLRRNAWVCVQVSATIGNPGRIEVSFDGNRVILDEGPVDGPFTNIWFGEGNAESGGPEVRFDEVVIDSSPIPCD